MLIRITTYYKLLIFMKILNVEKMLAVRIAGYIILKWSGCVNKQNKGRDGGY